jgi:integrase
MTNIELERRQQTPEQTATWRRRARHFGRNFLRQWYLLLDRAGMEHRPLHDARHGAASLMLSQGVPLKVAQETLGHSTIRLTADLYGHLMPGDAEKVADVIDQALA